MSILFRMFVLWMFVMPLLFAGTEVEIVVVPGQVVKMEPFELVFKVTTDYMGEVFVNFDQEGMDVISFEKREVGLKTLFVSGHMTTIKEDHFVYNMISPKSGTKRIENIKISAGKEIVEEKDYKISVVNSAPEAKDFIVRAELSKDKIYVGEALRVDYVLYNRIRVDARDIKQFPKLNGFIKRFIEPGKTVSRVSINNEVYEKYAMYSLMLFPERPGKLKIDPIKLRLQYPYLTSQMGGGTKIKDKTVSSIVEDLEVLPLPTPLPDNFSGLVGKHQMSISTTKSQFLVNEAIEAKLIIKGPGLLEKFDPPKIYQHKSLEEFETSADLKMISGGDATKTVEYSYLGRAVLNLDKRVVTMSYFDPGDGSYKEVELLVPSISVFGGVTSDKVMPQVEIRHEEPAVVEEKKVVNNVKPVEGSGVVAPVFSFNAQNLDWFKWINILLGLLILAILLVFWKGSLRHNSVDECNDDIDQIRQDGLNYSRLHHLLIALDPEKGRIYGKNLLQIVNDSSLDDETKNYFSDLIRRCEEAQFQKSEKRVDFTFEEKYFKAVKELVEG